MRTYEDKKQELYRRMREYRKDNLCIAFSGGVDSSVLLGAAKAAVKECSGEEKSRMGHIYAVTFHTMLHPSCDMDNARKVAEEAGVCHEIIYVNELEQEEIRFNPVNRCYLCKKALFEKLKDFAVQAKAPVILEGTNEDDLHVYRPGRKALEEMGIISPLALCGFTKAEVRRLAGEMGISAAHRPSAPCLATRLPYGAEIKPGILEDIAAGEEYLKEIGFEVVRLRLHGEIARIEVPCERLGEFLEKREKITRQLKKLGFSYITLDMEGFRSGSMDEHLTSADPEVKNIV